MLINLDYVTGSISKNSKIYDFVAKVGQKKKAFLGSFFASILYISAEKLKTSSKSKFNLCILILLSM